MTFKHDTIDDILHHCIKKVIDSGLYIQHSSKGPNYEISPSLIILTNPLARISLSKKRGKSFSPFGELLWYLNASDELNFIKYYIPDYRKCSDNGVELFGAYGPRIFNPRLENNQFQNCYEKLKKKPDTKHAIIQILRSEDLFSETKDLPCTISLQFLIRNKKLFLHVNMRSNDALFGLSHDLFCFTYLQEIMARKLNIGLGEYYHYTSSLHLYEDKLDDAQAYLKEGFQSTMLNMPEMPTNKIDESLQQLLDNENKIRQGDYSFEDLGLDEYWKDILRILEAYNISKSDISTDKKKELLRKINIKFSVPS